jgi:hypothetical protein
MQVYSDLRPFYERDRAGVYKGPGEMLGGAIGGVHSCAHNVSCDVQDAMRNIGVTGMYPLLPLQQRHGRVRPCSIQHGRALALVPCYAYDAYGCHYADVAGGAVLAGKGAAFEQQHLVQVVGYDNSRQAWLVKNSWGDGWASEGYGWVSYDAPGMCDPDYTYGFKFSPKQPPAAAKPRLTVVPGRSSCYSYRAIPGDYPEALATKFGLRLQQLLLDNLAVLRDPSRVPPGATLVLCGVSPAALAGAVVASGGPSRGPVVLVPAPRPTVQPPTQPLRVRPAVVMPRSGPVGVVPSSSPADEVAALLAIKRVLDPPGTALTDWQPGSSTPCSWTGVTCDASSKRVEVIDFVDAAAKKAKVQLSGQLPSGALLRRLPGLIAFGVEGTGVGGPLPEDWSQLRQLKEVSVVGNKLTGGCGQRGSEWVLWSQAKQS